MKLFFLTALVLAGLLSSAAVSAGYDCTAAVSTWQPREALRKQLEQQGWQVHRIKVDDGCYEVRGIDAEGHRFKAKYAPESLIVIKMEIKSDQRGKLRHQQIEDPK